MGKKVFGGHGWELTICTLLRLMLNFYKNVGVHEIVIIVI